MIVAEALRRAGVPDRAQVLEQVRQLRDFEGVSGLINFDPTGERVNAPVGLYRVHKTDQGLEMGYLGITSELLPL
jgi:ABC-type branched-subunit amino acid transport system substrate-binding protein